MFTSSTAPASTVVSPRAHGRYRFFSVPGHLLTEEDASLPTDAWYEVQLPSAELVESALTDVQFRDGTARERLVTVLQGTDGVYSPPGSGWAKSAVFAAPPGDLPALLRLADQLDAFAQPHGRERAQVWQCQCGTRYAVPLSLVRTVSIRCERCDTPIELSPTTSVGEESLLAPMRESVNACRRQLAAFFREAMARGWPVLVSVPAGE